jgi:type II secretory pathway pseudopilin PulG
MTLLELVVAVVIIGVMAAMAIPAMSQTSTNARLKGLGMSLSGALNLARSEAIRTGNIQIVFLGQDAQGNVLLDGNGVEVPVLILDDGRPGSVNQNCQIDVGEIIQSVAQEPGVSIGVSGGAPAAPGDQGTGDITTGSSYVGPDTLAASWVLFRPEGTPRSFDIACATGAMGSGAGAFYLTNGTRNVSVVVSPMGALRVHGWNQVWSL